LRKDIVRGSHSGILPAPSNFRVSHGQKSGTLNAQATRLPGAGSYEVQILQGDPSIEANWKYFTSSVSSAHILLEGLIPAQTYWIRLRAIGSPGAGLWTDPIRVIVI
jgi:hypothetical protein